MSEFQPKSKYSSANIDQGCLIQLDIILKQLQDEITTLGPGEKPSINQLSAYLSNRSNIIQLVQLYSFASTINNHTDLISCANKFTKLIDFCSSVNELHQFIKPLIDGIISNSNIKVFYRCLNIHRPNITNPILKLMTVIVDFNNGSYVDQFLELFDLTLKSLPHLLIPLAAEKINTELARSEKQSVRCWMIKFWLTLSGNASSITRNDLLSNNKKIMSHLFKYMPTYDSEKTIKLIIEFCDSKILMEPAFKKVTKGKILNEWALSKIAEVFQREELNDLVKNFLNKLATDDEHGLSFYDTRTFFVNSPFSTAPTGAAITIGERTFRINNKLIYILLTHLTPWANTTQLDLLISILTHIPELIAPYTSYIFFNHGTHEPRLTAFYIGQSLLLTRILLIPAPLEFKKSLKEFIHSLDPSANNNVLISKTLTSEQLCNVVCPPMFTRGVLVKGLNSEDGLIKHNTVQLIVAATKKYQYIIEALSLDDNSVLGPLRLELHDIFLQRIPEPGSIVGAVNDVLNPSNDAPINKLLLVTLLKLVEKYNSVLGINVPVSLGNFGNLIGVDLGENDQSVPQKELSNIDMLLLNTYLELISSSTNDGSNKNKWWNITKNSKNTLFTIIAKLPWSLKTSSIDQNLVRKVVNVLHSLTEDKLIFESSVLESPCWAIVLSILLVFQYRKGDPEVVDTICKIIDESISRCVKTPYKYIDMSTNLSKTGRLSPYYFALCEQSKFAKEDQKNTVLEWLNVITMYLSILGEPLESMNSAFKNYWDRELSFNMNSLEGYINSNQDVWNVSRETSCFFDLISFNSLEGLRNVINSTSLVCKSRLDSVSLIGRLSHLIYSNNDKRFQLEKLENLFVDILSLWGNYLMHTYTETLIDGSKAPILDARYWNSLMFKEGDDDGVIEKKYFIIGLLNEAFLNLWDLDNSGIIEKEQKFESLRSEVCELLENCITKQTDNRIISKCVDLMWVLNRENVKKYINLCISHEVDMRILKKLLILTVKNGVLLEEDTFIELIGKFVKQNDLGILPSLTEKISLSNDRVEQLLALSLKEPLYFEILKAIASKSSEQRGLVINSIKSNVEVIEKKSGFELVLILSEDEELFKPLLLKTALSNIDEIISGSQQIDDSILPYFRALATNTDHNKVNTVVDTLFNNDSFKNNATLIFSQEFTEFITQQGQQLSVQLLRSWIHRATLYITKMFAESDFLPSQFVLFLESLQQLYFNGTFWNNISKQMIDSQLETILSGKWVDNLPVLKYVNILVITAKGGMIDTNRNLAFYFNNSANPLNTGIKNEPLRFQSCLLLHNLLKSNNKAATLDFMLKIVKIYRGTTQASDVVLKQILCELEGTLRTSWAEYVTTWDYVEEFNLKDNSFAPELVIDTPGIANGLTINLNKHLLTNTMKYFIPFENSDVFHFTSKKKIEEWDQWLKFQETYDLYNASSNGEIVYDVEFILLLIGNNEELFNLKTEDDLTTIVVNMRALIDTGLMQLCVMGLGHESRNVKQIASKLISAAFKWNNFELDMIEKFREQKNKPNNTSIDQADSEFKLSPFKERSMFKVLLGNILYTIQDKEAETSTSRLSLMVWSNLIPILGNPAHFLYEKAYRYLLMGPRMKPLDIPLYKSITEQLKDAFGTEETEDSDYQKEIEWLLSTINDSITGSDDLKVLKRINIFEHIMNLTQSPYLKDSVMGLIKKLIKRVIVIENGADLLIRSYGLLSSVEGQSILAKMNIKMKGVTEDWQQVGIMALVGSQSNGSDKRGMEWTDGDYNRIVKRLCK